MYTLQQFRMKLSKFWRRCLGKILIKYQDKHSLPNYIEMQLFVLKSEDFVKVLKGLTGDIRFPARTDNVEQWHRELFKLNHAYKTDESLRPHIRSSGQHMVSAKSYMTDKDSNYLDGNTIMPQVLEEIKSLVTNYKQAASGTSSRDINNTFILEHYLNNIRETLGAWILITYGD